MAEGSIASERMGWSRYVVFSVGSQFLNAGTNALLVILLARALTRHGFGVQALALTILPLVLAGFRGVCLEPAVIHGYGRDLHRKVFGDSVRAALLCAAGTAVLPILARGSAAIGGLLALGAGLAVLEEAGRWLLARSERPHVSALADLAWAVVQVGVLTAGFHSPIVVALSWAAGGAASVLVAWGSVFWLGARERLLIPTAPALPETPTTALPARSSKRRQPRHLRSTPRYNWNWGLEYLTAASTPQFVLLLGPLTGGVGLSGAISAAMTLTGAATVVTGGAQQLIVARLRLIRSAATMRRWAFVVSALLGVAVLVCTVPLLFVPASLGRHLLGASWPTARAVLPAIIVQKTAVALSMGPILVTRRLPTYRLGLWYRLPLSVLTIVAAVGVAYVGGAPAAAVALAAGAGLAVVVWVIIVASLTRPEGEMDRYFARGS